MRHWVAVHLAVAAALVLGSCAGFVPAVDRAVDRTADLYDMDSYLLARGRAGATPVADIALPLPPLTDSIVTVPVPAGNASIAVTAMVPALPVVPGPAEVGYVNRPAASVAKPIVLAVPTLPAGKAAAAKPSTAKPATAAPPAPVPTPPAPGAAKPASAATAPSAKKLREVYARVGDEIEVGLDGVAFLFLGFADRQTDSMTFKARTVKDGRTFFTFKALKLGTWELDFQQQDNASGATRAESVRVVVLEESDFAEAVRRQTGRGGEAVLDDLESGRAEWAEKLAALGRENAAIAEYLKGYREGNPELNDRIAALYTRTGDPTAAEKYWRKNVGAVSPWGDRAVVGIARLAVARGDLDGYLAWHRQLLAVSAEPIDDLLVDAARAARAKGDVGLGIDLLSVYGRRYPGGKRLDEAVFITAGLLEADSPFRDLKRSRDLYAALLREYPESAHAADAAARLRYLDQHFFTIR